MGLGDLATDRPGDWSGKTQTLWDVRIPMRDGVTLSADVHLPRRGPGAGPFPAIVERNCYTHQLNESSHTWFTQFGYAVVLQDVRGRNDSDGTFYPIHQEVVDGYDTIEWIASQPWCTGAVGTIGGSYMGWTQWAAAKAKPPHLRAMWTAACAGAFLRQEPFENGILLLPGLAWLHLTSARTFHGARSVDWRRIYHHLPLRSMDEALGRDLPVWREWLAHPRLDQYWSRTALSPDDFASIDIPAVCASGWWDSNLVGTVMFYRGMREFSPASARQQLLIGPWLHEGVGTGTELGPFSFGAHAALAMQEERLRWFDRWLKDTDVEVDVGARIFVTGANEWRLFGDWPPESRPVSFYLRSDGSAGTHAGGLTTELPDDEPPDIYRYDPADPFLAIGGDWNFYPYSARDGFAPYHTGFYDPASDPNARADVLIYKSAPIRTQLTVIGAPDIELFASSDSPDTDWFVSVADEAPDGQQLPLSIGQLRARFRESLEREVLLVPGEVYPFRFAGRPMAHAFKPGHRIVVTITSSRFPVADRNLNTGHPIGEDDEIRVATNSVFHDRVHASCIRMPGHSNP